MHDVSTSPTTFRSSDFRQKTTEVVKFYLLKFEEQNMTYVTKNYRARTPNNQPNPIDVFIGSRIRHFRKLRRISQVELAASVGTTFQQIQKYENGSNRVSGSRLWMISQSLEVPVALFFRRDKQQNRPYGGKSDLRKRRSAVPSAGSVYTHLIRLFGRYY